MKERTCIGVDIGGSHISCLGVDLDKQEILKNTLARIAVSHEAQPGPILDAWSAAISKTIHLVDRHITGIGIAVPGPFDYRRGVSEMEHKFIALKGISIPDALHERLDIKGIEFRFLNDALAFAVGEAWIGAGKKAEKIIVLTLGTGFGSAYTDQGIPVVNRADVAPEGCFWHLPFREGIADDYFSTRWFVHAYRELTGKKVKGVKEIASRADIDPHASQLFDAFGSNLGEFLAPWLRKYQPDLLIIGGNIALSLELFEPSFTKMLKREGIQVRVRLSALMENAAMVGAARLFDPLFWRKHKESDQPL